MATPDRRMLHAANRTEGDEVMIVKKGAQCRIVSCSVAYFWNFPENSRDAVDHQ